jgi:hypothetical protein
MLQLVLPATDSGAAEADRLNPPDDGDLAAGEPGDVDSPGGNA